ncbi:glycoside hydrolase superfamily [Xylogone sp. PMI_703]|nr:glycoside hydrolase superfamily [Xylogone sp. PMI_703]
MVAIDSNIDQILSRLTLEEKISLLTGGDWWRTLIIRQNGKKIVPHLKTTDGPNGARGEGYVNGVKSACFPCGTCVGASFDEDLAFEVGKQIGLEALSKSANVLLAPTVNVIRSPLGGRNHECFSEDPFVLGVMGAAYIRGCQSTGVGATVKHFVANDVEKRRRFLTANMDERTLREIYLYPFQLILKLSDPWCLMTSFNKVNGVYVADDSRLLQNVLRGEWGYKGLIMSDWNGTYSTVEAMNAGIDLEMPGVTKYRGEKLLHAIVDKTVTEKTVEDSARRVLELVKRSGQFESPEEEPEQALLNHSRDDFITRSAAEGAVLLRNEGSILPLDVGNETSKIVVIGHHAAIPAVCGGGSARVNSTRTVSPLVGLRDAGLKFHYEPGVPVFAAIPSPIPSVLSKSAHAENESSNDDMTTVDQPVWLEFFNGSVIGSNLVHEKLLEKPEYLLKEQWPTFLDKNYCTRMTFTITPKSTGTHTMSVLTTGTAILYIDGVKAFTRDQDMHLQREAFYFFRSTFERRFSYSMTANRTYSCVLESWGATEEALANSVGGPAIQGSGVGFFEYVDISGQIRAAAAAAAQADIAIVFTGTTGEFESEGYDRDTLDLTPKQYELVSAITSARPHRGTVLVNYSGAPVNMNPFLPHNLGSRGTEDPLVPSPVEAILQCWFPGQECGHSIAALLTGRINPSGRVPMSWPRRIEDNPSHGNFPTDDNDVIHYKERIFVGYRHYDLPENPAPLFPFGFGLSYTTFIVEGTKIATPALIKGREGKIQVSCTVKNTGQRSGKIVLQFYIQAPSQPQPIGDKVGMYVDRPVKELKGFKKPFVEAGNSQKVSIELDRYAVSFYDMDRNSWRAIRGTYQVLVGFSAAEIVDSAKFNIEEDFEWTGV